MGDTPTYAPRPIWVDVMVGAIGSVVGGLVLWLLLRRGR